MKGGYEPLRRTGEFARLYRRGQAVKGRFVVLRFLRNGLAVPRAGITVSGQVGGAVERNRVKRRLREVLRRFGGLLPAGYDMVLSARASAREAPFGELVRDVESVLGRLGIRRGGGPGRGDGAPAEGRGRAD